MDVLASSDAVVMAAAVADFRPQTAATTKLKKTSADPDPVVLVRNPDILAEISHERGRPGQVIVGFAAETDDVLANGRAKLTAKGCDLLVVNEVGEHRAFDRPDNAATILERDGAATEFPLGSKDELAHAVWDLVSAKLAR
jgi:phosphopantothenoylcysteine decarboxylase / phosphopantothenate---cysteine ligase